MTLESQAFDAAWTRFQVWLAQHAPHILNNLQPSTSLDDFNQLSPEYARLPEQLKRLYSLTSGQQRLVTVRLLPGLRLLSPAEIVEEAESWRDHFEQSQADVAAGFDAWTVDSMCPTGFVKDDYYRPGFLPFMVDDTGNGLALDLVPESLGTFGQIINFGADEVNRYVIASSLAGLFKLMTDLLESGVIFVSVENEEQLFCTTGDEPFYLFLDLLAYLHNEGKLVAT